MHPKIIQAIDVARATSPLNKITVWSTLNFLPGKIQLFAQNLEGSFFRRQETGPYGIHVAESLELFALDEASAQDARVRFGSARKRHFLFL